MKRMWLALGHHNTRGGLKPTNKAPVEPVLNTPLSSWAHATSSVRNPFLTCPHVHNADLFLSLRTRTSLRATGSCQLETLDSNIKSILGSLIALSTVDFVTGKVCILSIHKTKEQIQSWLISAGLTVPHGAVHIVCNWHRPVEWF